MMTNELASLAGVYCARSSKQSLLPGGKYITTHLQIRATLVPEEEGEEKTAASVIRLHRLGRFYS